MAFAALRKRSAQRGVGICPSTKLSGELWWLLSLKAPCPHRRGLGDLLVLWGLEESHYAQRLSSVLQRHERMEMLALGDSLVGWEAPGSTLMLESFGLHVPGGPRRTWDSWDPLLLIASIWESSEWALWSSQGLWCWCLAPEVLLGVVLWQGRAVLRYWFPEGLMFILSSVIVLQDTLDRDLWNPLKLCLRTPN